MREEEGWVAGRFFSHYSFWSEKQEWGTWAEVSKEGETETRKAETVSGVRCVCVAAVVGRRTGLVAVRFLGSSWKTAADRGSRQGRPLLVEPCWGPGCQICQCSLWMERTKSRNHYIHPVYLVQIIMQVTYQYRQHKNLFFLKISQKIKKSGTVQCFARVM